MNILHLLITRPLGILLMWLYQVIGSYGITIIVFTVIFRLLMFPLQLKSKHSTMAMNRLAPQVKAIQKKLKADPTQMNREVQALYKAEGVSMMSGCLPMLLTLPLMMALYYAINRPLTFMMGLSDATIYEIADKVSFTITNMFNDQIPLANLITQHFDKVREISHAIVPIDFKFLGLDLSATPSLSHPTFLWIIPILSGLSAFLQSKVSMQLNPTANNQANPTMKSMMYMMPLMSLYFAFVLPSGIGLYWIVGNVMMIVQEIVLTTYITRKHEKKANKGEK